MFMMPGIWIRHLAHLPKYFHRPTDGRVMMSITWIGLDLNSRAITVSGKDLEALLAH